MWSSLIVVVLLAISIDAAPKPNYGPLSRYNNNNEDVGVMLIERKPLRNFDILKIGGGFGFAKRYENGEKHRRGPLNGLIPGGAFGRAARSNNNNQRLNEDDPPNYDKITKLFYGQFDDVFDENRNNLIDGQPSMMKVGIGRNPQESDTTNQYNNNNNNNDGE